MIDGNNKLRDTYLKNDAWNQCLQLVHFVESCMYHKLSIMCSRIEKENLHSLREEKI
jgi:hypothetical protein